MAKPAKKEAGKKKQEQKEKSNSATLPLILAAILFGLMIAFQTGLLDINEFKHALGLSKNETIPGTCPITSKDTGNECWSVDKVNGIRVSGVITYEWCNCPTDTDFASWDNITGKNQGINFRICTCKSK